MRFVSIRVRNCVMVSMAAAVSEKESLAENCSTTSLGTGAMPLKELIALDEAAQVRAVVLETHQNWINDSPLDSIRMSGNWLKENL